MEEGKLPTDFEFESVGAFWEAEDRAQEAMHRKALKLGLEEWRKGQTREAFKLFEAARVPKSFMAGKARVLEEAEGFYAEWLVGAQRISGAPRSTDPHFAPGYFLYCRAERCPRCSALRLHNANYAERLYAVLGWDKPREPYRDHSCSDPKRPLVKDLFALHVLGSKGAPRNEGSAGEFYHAALIAAVDLANRTLSMPGPYAKRQ